MPADQRMHSQRRGDTEKGDISRQGAGLAKFSFPGFSLRALRLCERKIRSDQHEIVIEQTRLERNERAARRGGFFACGSGDAFTGVRRHRERRYLSPRPPRHGVRQVFFSELFFARSAPLREKKHAHTSTRLSSNRRASSATKEPPAEAAFLCLRIRECIHRDAVTQRKAISLAKAAKARSSPSFLF